MFSSSVQKMIIAGIALALIGFFGYQVFVVKIEAPITDDLYISNTEVVGGDILNLVEKTKDLTIDKSIFSSNLFISLVDFNITLSPENKGRPNPFAPIGSDSSSGVVVNAGN